MLCDIVISMTSPPTTSIPLTRIDAVGAAIREWRRAAGLSQAALAERIGTTQSAVSRWEHGHEEPRLSTLVAILRGCGLTGELLIGEDVDRAQIRRQLALSPRRRLEGLTNVSRLRATAKRTG
jgi:transcriptional regulator with XRE-family HTH domain